jgi:hypothetical protein
MRNIININEIKSIIGTTHSAFLNNYKSELEKIPADLKLIREMATAKLKFILNAFVELNILSKVDYHDGKYAQFILTKDGLDGNVRILTNGENMIIDTKSEVSNELSDDEVLYKVFDTEDDHEACKKISVKILDAIHKHIYYRKDLAIQKIDNLMYYESN